MANKYIIEGATYCGDGTSSSVAASAGAVGAWNNINVLEDTAPAYGTLAAGDVVYIRSKTSAGADITLTLAATVTLGSSAAIATAPVTWVLDNGSVWPGIDGVLRYNCPSGYLLNARAYNTYIAQTQDAWMIVETNPDASYKYHWSGDNVSTKNLLFDFSLLSSSYGASMANVVNYYHENIHIISNKRPGNLLRANAYSRNVLINPDIELLNPAISHPALHVHDSSVLEVFGGQVRGAGAVAGSSVFRYRSGSKIIATGFTAPKAMTFAVPDTAGINDIDYSHEISAIGTDGGSGAYFKERWGLADSRDDNSFPRLSSTLPNTINTLWSWKLCPLTVALLRPMKITSSKYYTESAASKTITLEVLVASTLSNVTKSTLWIVVEYIDNSTGLCKYISSKTIEGGSLDNSTANWIPNIDGKVAYAAASLLKYRLSVTTPTSIKQNTMVIVTLWGTVAAASTIDIMNDIMFMCPDFLVTEP